MENYTVTIQYGNCVAVEFQARSIECSANQGIALARINEFEVLADKGFLFLNFDTMRASFSYDIFSFEWDITEKKEADGHYSIKCTNGSNMVEIELSDPC